VLGPYVGPPTEHARIPVGKGVCGAAVAEDRDQVVDDVSKRPDYLACSPTVRSEIVVLVREGGRPDGRVVGQIDLDSERPAAFSEDDHSFLRAVAAALGGNRAAGIATIATPIRDPAELFDPDVVKVVLDDAGLARWFTRAPVPWVRGGFDHGPPAALPEGVPFLRHVGLYAYRVGVLKAICAAPPAVHESAERLEQLRAVTRGVAIIVAVMDNVGSRGVDSPSDLARIQHEFSGRATD
jgi:hypothetical protein